MNDLNLRYETILAKTRLGLALVSVKRLPVGEKGKCPQCGNDEFINGPYDWTECTNCDFAVSTSRLMELQNAKVDAGD